MRGASDDEFTHSPLCLSKRPDAASMNRTEERNATEIYTAIDSAPLDSFEFLVTGILIMVLGVVGIIGNVLTLIILSRPQMKSSVNCGLQALAIFDTGVTVCAIFMLGLRTLGKVLPALHFYTWQLFPMIVPVLYPLALMFQTGSVWTTVAVTVERYVAVCHPLKARCYCTLRRARYYNVVVTVFAVCYNIPRFLEVRQVEVTDILSNKTLRMVVPSAFRLNKVYFEAYYVWLYLFVMYFIPFVTLSVLNVKIWRAIRRANRDRQQLSLKQQREISLAVMLLCVVVTFFFCHILALLVNILEYIDLYCAPLVHISNLLVTFNSSVNFLIYCIFGRKFKRIFLVLFCKQDFQQMAVRDSQSKGYWFRFKSFRTSSTYTDNYYIHRSVK